ncbi:YceI family protein [Bryobacter aggregatus]|uniref:YceI family protein n=1 Tax=Bryobacter aggregatus TaxID=360054 RepID=UPI0004E22629|nr:YceI family protein [Bryobacter aggregatus]
MIRNLLFVFGSALSLAAQSYQIDTAHSGASFTVKHMMVTNVTGRFSNIKGSIVYDDKDLAKSHIEASIDVDTVNTNQAKRDAHLKSADFFDVAKYPTMRFQSTKVYRTGNVFFVDGDLTLHGVTKAVTLTLSELSPEVKSPQGGFVRGGRATTKISRSAFGLKWNKTIDTGGVVVGDEIQVTLDIEATRPGA